MLVWLLALAAGVAAAFVQYRRGALTPRAAPLAALRALVVALVVALLMDAPAGRAPAARADVAVDGSESWLRGAPRCTRWRDALDSAHALGARDWMRFGDSLRVDRAELPSDRASRLRPVVDRAAATGRPVVIFTDGELDDPEAAAVLPRGSRVVVMPCAPARDVAVSTLDAPTTLVAGDTTAVQVTLVAGGAGSNAGVLRLQLDATVLAESKYDALPPYGERALALRVVPTGADRSATLRAIATTATGDAEPRNDTLAVGVSVSRAPAAVFVSTAPDYDAREAVAALRGVTSLPTRAYYRVAPGAWRMDGTLARVDEATVRSAVRDAPLVVLHGDTSIFGPPREASRGSLLLFAPPPADDGEWFAAAAPASPVAAAFATLPFDSLSPISVSAAMPRGAWQGLVARRGGAPDDRRVALVGYDAPRRVAVLGASGLWRWRFRGGARADAYAVLMGSLYDWLAAGRSDRRAVVLDAAPVRAGAPIRWRRAGSADSVIAITITRRSATSRVYSMTLRYGEGASMAETPPLVPGEYDVKMPGGSAVLVVNAARELVPRRPTVGALALGEATRSTETRRIRDVGWIWIVVMAALCAEWVLRRRAGLR